MATATNTIMNATVNSGAGLDMGTIIIALIPFILFLLLVYWGFGKKDRKKRVIELSYNLIALELLMFLILPLCDQPVSCGVWAIIPIAMFTILIFFMYHRFKKEREYKNRIAKALADGHLNLSGVLEGKLEEEIKRAIHRQEKEKKNKSTKNSPKKEDINLKSGAYVSISEEKQTSAKELEDTEDPEHKKIGQVVERIVKKKKAAKKKTKKKV